MALNELTERIDRVNRLGNRAIELLKDDSNENYLELQQIFSVRAALWIEIGQIVSRHYDEGIPLIVYKGETSDGSHTG